ncbi:MAG: flagellin lysine-N-methylase, partial [Ignavibacteriales bacterium]
EIDTHSILYDNRVEKYFWDLRIFTIQLLQNRNNVLADRLIILGMFYLDLEESINNIQVDSIPHLISAYSNSIDSGELNQVLSEIPVLSNIQLEFLKLLMDLLVPKTSKRYTKCYNQFLEGIDYGKEKPIEEIMKSYNDAFEKYYYPFMVDHKYMLENYLVNYVFMNIFPIGKYPSVYEEYIMLIIHYALIKLQLIGLAGFHKGLNYDLIVEFIQSFAKNFEHNQQNLDRLLKVIQGIGYTEMSHMMILIKN